MTAREKLRRELHADLEYLRHKAAQLFDKVTLTQADIVLVKARLMRLRRGKLRSIHG